MSIKELYEKSIESAENRTIIANNVSEKPTITSGIITPDSSIEVNMLGHNFLLDKDGMLKIIDSFEKRWANEPNKNNLMTLLVYVYNTINDFLGGDGNETNRKNAYWDAGPGGLTISQMEGKQIGQCIERSAIGHQLLTLLKQAGITHFESALINTEMSSKEGEEMGQHSLITLVHPTDNRKKLIFDIENPRYYFIKGNEKPTCGIGLYLLTEGEYKAFLNGKNIAPQTIYDASGIKIEGDKYVFGNGDEMYQEQSDVEFE